MPPLPKKTGGTFVVVAGVHEESTPDGVVRHTKDTGPFDSPLDLDVLFANKFIRQGAPTKKPRDFTEDLDGGGGGRVMDKPHHRAANEVEGLEEDEQENLANTTANEDDGGPGTEEVEAEPESPRAVVNKVAAKKVVKKKS